MGCTQPAPTASPTPVPTATVQAFVTPSPTAEPTATLEPTVTPEPTVSPTPVPTVSAAVPGIADFAKDVSKAAAQVFNVTREPRQPDQFTWVIEDFASTYRYQIYVRPSRTKAWTSFDSVYPIVGSNNVTREASVSAEGAGAYYHYDAVMKCFGAAYDVELDLRDYRQTAANEFYTDLGPNVMASFVSVCPA